MRRIINGTRVSLARTIAYSAYYIGFGILVLSPSFFIGIPSEYFLGDLALGIFGFFAAFELARRRLVFWKSGNDIYSKGGLIIYLTYIAGLVARLAISYVYLNGNVLPLPGQPLPVLNSAGINATIITDLLLMGGVGVLFGRNMRILKTYLDFKKGKTVITEDQRAISTGNESPSSQVN
jgi:hypothetical protein